MPGQEPDAYESLTVKQRTFVDEYLKDLNATQAYIRAGYSAKHADTAGPRLRSGNVGVSRAIEGRIKARRERLEAEADWIVLRMASRLQQNISGIVAWDKSCVTLTPSDELSEEQLACIQEVSEVRHPDGALKARNVKMVDRLGTERLLMQHLGMLRERHEHSGPNGKPIEHSIPQLNVIIDGSAPDAETGKGVPQPGD